MKAKSIEEAQEQEAIDHVGELSLVLQQVYRKAAELERTDHRLTYRTVVEDLLLLHQTAVAFDVEMTLADAIHSVGEHIAQALALPSNQAAPWTWGKQKPQ